MAAKFASKHTSNSSLYIKVALWTIFPLLSSLFLVIYVHNANSVIIHNGTSSFAYGVYTDKESGGQSEGTVKKEGQSITFTYQLNAGHDFPYAGLYFTIPPKTLDNIQQPQCFHLELKASRGIEIPIILNEKITIEGIDNHRLWQYNLKLTPDHSKYKVLLSDFAVPAWWHKQHPQFNGAATLDLTKVDGLSIQNCTHIGIHKQDLILLKAIYFQKDFSQWYQALALGLSLWVVAGAIYAVLHKKKKHVFIPFVTTSSEHQSLDDWERIQTYISAHYMEDLSMETLQQELGIAKHKIAALVKENTSLIFKQYLNQIRIAEATRLLIETDLPIGEIADKVGYGHISNFNRVFKEYTKKAPSDLRKDVHGSNYVS